MYDDIRVCGRTPNSNTRMPAKTADFKLRVPSASCTLDIRRALATLSPLPAQMTAWAISLNSPVNH